MKSKLSGFINMFLFVLLMQVPVYASVEYSEERRSIFSMFFSGLFSSYALGVFALVFIALCIMVFKEHNKNNLSIGAEEYASDKGIRVLDKKEDYVRTYTTERTKNVEQRVTDKAVNSAVNNLLDKSK